MPGPSLRGGPCQRHAPDGRGRDELLPGVLASRVSVLSTAKRVQIDRLILLFLLISLESGYLDSFHAGPGVE